MAPTILVVDVNRSAVTSLVTTLAKAGFVAIGARGFADALNTLARLEPKVLITSVQLGPYNGLHLLLRARAIYPDLAGIVIGPADTGLARDARSLGARVYLTAPSADAVVSETSKMLSPSTDAGVHAGAPASASA